MSRHIATHGHKGWAGNRVGTRYLYTFAEAHVAQDQPWFRWKNDEARKGYSAWLDSSVLSSVQPVPGSREQRGNEEG